MHYWPSRYTIPTGGTSRTSVFPTPRTLTSGSAETAQRVLDTSRDSTAPWIWRRYFLSSHIFEPTLRLPLGLSPRRTTSISSSCGAATECHYRAPWRYHRAERPNTGL